MLRSFVLAFLIAGCAEGADVASDPAAAHALLGGKTDDANDGAVEVIDGGRWSRTITCPSPSPASCQYEDYAWVDLAVRNDAYDKRVGIVWIDTVRDDASAPWHIAYAAYEGDLGDGFEQWGLDVSTGARSGIAPTPHIRYAAFAEMNGVITWDNNSGADHELP